VDGKETAIAGSDLKSFGQEDQGAGHHEGGYRAAGRFEEQGSENLRGAEGDDGESGEFMKSDWTFASGKKLTGENRLGGRHRYMKENDDAKRSQAEL
jgi:hypothetical protein